MLKDTLNPTNSQLINKIFSTDKPTHVYMHNYHLLNHTIAKACKRHGAKFIYHVHEPYVENKRAHGGLQQYWLHLNEFMGEKLLRDTDIAIVSSKEGLRLFEKKYPLFKGYKVQIPLIYEDIAENLPAEERKYITFVGPPVPAKNPELFLSLVDFAAMHNLDWSFLLISREKISDPKYQKKNLTLYYKKRISDEEFGMLMRKSLVVLTPYKRETQSSVILVSYMYGTPVVSSNVGGLPEFVDIGQTGYVVNIDAPIEQWINEISQALNIFEKMQINCRKFFIENFSSYNWKKYLINLLGDEIEF